MIQDLLQFLDNSPVNFLAVDTLRNRLQQAGFRQFDASASLVDVKPGTQFFVTKNDSSLYAFRMGNKPLSEAGFHMICAHCDSPTFRVKPNAEITCEGGITGRVIVKGQNAMSPQTRLLFCRKPLLQISNLAIHFNRQVNDGVKLSKQKDMLPILGIVQNELEKGNMLMNLISEEIGCGADEVLDFDLYLYDFAPACTFGMHGEFLSSGRLDDLSMVHAGLQALLQTGDNVPQTTQVLAIFDNEETGSQTKQGAGSPFLASILQRIVFAQGDSLEGFYRAVEKAFMISADNAHGWHPNYSDKYDPTNHPVLGGGPVIKFNAAQKYASDAASAAVFASICQEAGVPCQRFVNHSDVAGGSTLGNILASSLPLRGVDIGNPVLAMHSVRETASCADHEYCIRAFAQFYKQYSNL